MFIVCNVLLFCFQQQREEGEEVWTSYERTRKPSHQASKASANEVEEFWEEEYERNSFIDDEAIEVNGEGSDGDGPDQVLSGDEEELPKPKRHRRRIVVESSDEEEFNEMVHQVETRLDNSDQDNVDGSQSQVVRLLDEDEPPSFASSKASHQHRSRIGKVPTKEDLCRDVRMRNHIKQHQVSGSKPKMIVSGSKETLKSLIQRPDPEEDDLVLDMSERSTELTDTKDVEVRLDSTFSLTMGMVLIASKEAVGPEASYEAVTIHKEVGDKSAPINVSLPIRLLPALEKAMDLINEKIEGGGKLPEPEELVQRGDELGWKFNLEPFHLSQHPKVDIKLDGSFSLLGENIRWQKGSFQVLSFIRHAKHGEKKGKKAFSIGVPWKLFGSLRLGIKTFALMNRTKF